MFQDSPYSMSHLHRSMAEYFFNFQTTPDNIYSKLAKKIIKYPWAGAIVTLNYERLLQQSLHSVGICTTFAPTTQISNALEICLPHGSCNLFCEGAKGRTDNVFLNGTERVNGPIISLEDREEFLQRIKEDAFGSVMSYFEPSKRTTTGTSFIEDQRARYDALVSEANNIAIIGIMVREDDKHIWTSLQNTSGRLIFCGGSSGGKIFNSWCEKYRKGKEDKTIDKKFEEAFDELCELIIPERS